MRMKPSPEMWNRLRREAHAWLLWTKDTNAPPPARALCRVVLSQYAGINPADWKFAAGAAGKPRIAAPKKFASLKFNLTHTAGLAICIVTRAGEVGVDAENISREIDFASVARHFFSTAEQAQLAKLPASRRQFRFFQLWVMKEAYLKARGIGLLNERAFRHAPAGKWKIVTRKFGPHHVAASAVKNSSIKIKWLRFDTD